MLDFQCLHELDNHIDGMSQRIQSQEIEIMKQQAALEELKRSKAKLETVADRWREKIKEV